MGADTHGESNYDFTQCKGEWKNDCPYPECWCAKKIMQENLAEKSSIETLAWKIWEEDAKTNPMAVNPIAFTYGIKCFVSHMVKSNSLFSLKEVEDLLFKHYMEHHKFKQETLSEFSKDEIERFSRKLIQDWLDDQFKK